jgi:hypothetical protein
LYEVAPDTALQLKVTCATPSAAFTPVGAAGTAAATVGVTPDDGADRALSPTAFTAVIA